MKKYPVYRGHDQAVCFSCGSPLDPATAVDSDYPEGEGRYRADCTECHYRTYYDLRKAA